MNGGSLLWLDEARMHLSLVILSSLPSDDQINLEHVKEAHDLICKAMRRGKPQPVVEALDADNKDEVRI